MDTYHLKLTTLSPVFIGGRQGNDLNQWKFFKDANNIYVIDELGLAKALNKTNKIEEFCNFVNKNSQDGLQRFLSDNKYLGKEKSALAKYSFTSDNPEFPSSSSIKTCVKDKFLVPYVPGSSIKGFIRTALLYDFLDTIKTADKGRFVKLVNESIGSAKNNKKADDKIIAETISALAKENEEQSYWDILKAIKISDAYAKDKSVSKIVKGYNVRVFQSHPISISVEGIKDTVEFNFDVEIDYFMVEQLKEQLKEELKKGREHNTDEIILSYLDKIGAKFQLNNLLAICKKFSSKIIEKEKIYASSNRFNEISKFYNTIENSPNLIRVGYGSGLLSTTIYLLLEPEQLENVKERFFRHSRERNEFPKTRRYIVDNEKTPYLPFGWCSIEEVKDGREK